MGMVHCKEQDKHIARCHLLFVWFSETESLYIAQVALELTGNWLRKGEEVYN